MADNNAGNRDSRRGNLQPRAATAREANPAGSVRSTGGGGNNAPREAKRKAGPSGQKEKQRKETESPEGTRKTSEEGGQRMAREEQPQGKQEQGPEKGALGQWKVGTKDLQEGWETIKEIDKVLGHLEGRLDKVTAVIRQVAVQGGALELNAPGEDEAGVSFEESTEELEAPALRSSLEEHRIVDIQKSAPIPSEPGESREEPKRSLSGVERNDRRGKGELWPSSDEQRRRAEEEYHRLGGLSHGCRQSWDLKMREEKGPGRKINGLFCWTAKDSLILHEVAKAAGLEGRGYGKKVDSLYVRDMESTCAYCVPLVDWKGEVQYLWARGVDYIARLAGKEDPRRWYAQYPGMAMARDTEAQKKAPIEMVIALDNWKWMPVRQPLKLFEYSHDKKVKNKRVRARTQFGKRLLLLPLVEASEIIPAEEEDDDEYVEKGVSKEPTVSAEVLEEEENRDAQCIQRSAHELCEQMEVHRRSRPRTGGDPRLGGQGPGRRSAESWRVPGPPWWG